MKQMAPVIARIIARYFSGALMTVGFLAPETGARFAVDPDVIGVLGIAIGAISEGAYGMAVKKGWAR